jgi:hypothetical protein
MTIAGLRRRAFGDWSRRLVATGAAVLVFGVGLVAASPILHLWLHPDAGQPDHECAVTLFAHGAIQSCTAVVLVVIPLLRVVGRIFVPAGPDLVSPRYRLCPGRAPPGF